jgi:VWFA-related protein
MRGHVAASWVVVIAAGVVVLSAQEPPGSAAARASAAPAGPAPAVHILSPDAGAYISGPITLRASVDPRDEVRDVVFFVDGRQVCTATAPPYECAWDAGPSINAHQVRAVAYLTSGDRVVETLRTKSLGYADRVDVDAVQVTVTVADGGHFVPGIPRSAFHVKENGRRQAITYFSSEDVPLELIAAVDISGSMTTAMPALKQAVKNFLVAVPGQAQVTLLGFNDSIFALTRRATRPEDRIAAVDRLAPWGATALYDVILRGVDMLGQQTGRKALVVFTDGEDEGSHATIEDVKRRLQSSDVTLYMIGQGRGVTLDRLRSVMTSLATPTGGRALFTDKIEDLQTRFDEIIDELSNQYLLAYQPSNPAHDGTWRQIDVEVDGYGGVRARQGYRAVPAR